MSVKNYFIFGFIISGIGAVGIYTSLCKRGQPTFPLHALETKNNIVPVAIIGSGPAGLSAAVYTARAGFHTVVVKGMKPGGLLTETSYIENWPGEKRVLGRELMERFANQVTQLGVQNLFDVITQVDLSSWPYALKTSDGVTLHALAVIIATGATPKTLGVPGEHEYWGKGVSSCAVCDAPFFRGREVFIIGGGDSAVEQALQLAPHVKQVTLLVRKNYMRASATMQQKLESLANAAVLYNREVKKIIGDGHKVIAVDLYNSKEGDIRTTPIDGVFLAIGHNPMSTLVQGQVPTNGGGYVQVEGRSQKTAVPGVFAAGEVADDIYRQAGVAAGEGIKAALDAIAFLHAVDFTPEQAQKMRNKFFDVADLGPSVVEKITSIKEYEENVLQSKLPVALDFYTDYCASCMHMMPAYESVAKNLEGQMKFFKVDADKADQLAEKLYVDKVPCFMVFKDGKLVARYSDLMDKQQMREFFGHFL